MIAEKHYTPNSPNIIHEVIDGEAILISMETGSYYSIDSVGAVVWDHMNNGLSNSQIIEAIAAQYDGEWADIEQGVQQLFDQLQAELLIVVDETAANNGHLPAENDTANSQARPPFEAPTLHKYTDMEDLLLLDPIHDVDESGWPNTNPNNA